MAKFLSVFFLYLLSMALNASDLLPVPPELKPDIDFWVKVYTEVDTKSGYIHDADNLSVIYEELRFSANSSRASRKKIIDKAKRRYQRALVTIAQNPAAPMNFKLRAVKKTWPRGTNARSFRTASHNVRFQLGQSDRFKQGLVRSGWWKQHIRQVLKAQGLPLELDVLPHVESSFNPAAYSKVAAAGMWQFMPATARQFMRVDHIVDERMDPFVASEAAARLLKNNHGITGTWPLALTAYNHGAAGIYRASESLGSKNIVSLVRRYKGPAFGFASRNFYVSFLAALEVDRHAETYFGPLKLNKPVSYEELTLAAFLPAGALAEALAVSLASLKQHNPALLNTVWSGEKYIPKGFNVRYPKNQLSVSLRQAAAAVPANQRFAYQQPDVIHRIASGESLSVIARRYHTTVRQLMALNGITNAHSIRAGKELKLPGKVPAGRRAVSAKRTRVAAMPHYYVVRNGDSIWKIARQFNVSQAQLLAVNAGLNSTKTLIKVGQKVWLPTLSGSSAIANNRTYTIRSGDSLWSIAKRFNLKEKQLLSWNNLSNKHKIMPGDILRIGY